MNIKNLIKEEIERRCVLWPKVLKDEQFQKQVELAEKALQECLERDGRVWIFGNGGSAAEAQHFAGELVCQYAKFRRALPATALTTDSSIMTAQSNDYGFDTVFARQLKAHARAGDVVIGLTTSDVKDSHSANIYNAFKYACNIGCHNIGLFSSKTQELLKLVNTAIIVPNTHTDLIQEVHLTVIHILSVLIEERFSSEIR